jgi:hypothetical protein
MPVQELFRQQQQQAVLHLLLLDKPTLLQKGLN